MKWLLIALVGAGIYYFGFAEPKGEFDAVGNPKVVLFVVDGCPPCDDAANLLRRLRVDFELLRPMSDPDAQARFAAYRTDSYPLMVIGEVKATGLAKHKVIETYAKALGMSALGRAVQRVYQAHFVAGQPRVVMYGAAWCGFCKRARTEFAEHGIHYLEWDVERDDRAAARFRHLQGDGYPLIYVGFERMHQFDKSRINAALRQSAEAI